MTCKVTTNISVPFHDEDAHIPAKLRATVNFSVEATAIHHYESASMVCDGEDWVEIEEIPYMHVEIPKIEDGQVIGWWEFEYRDTESARIVLASWGVDVDELATEDWVGKDSYADAMGADVDAAYDKYHDEQNDW